MPEILVDESPGSRVFWNTEEILIFARVLANDVQGGLSGQDLADDRPGTWELLNLCYADLAEELEDTNVESAAYAEDIIHLPISAISTDPSAQSHLDYGSFTDTAGNAYDNPRLPPDLVEPLFLWQRPTGQDVPFREMKQKLGGLASPYNIIGAGDYGGMYGTWEFRQNGIYFSGGCMQPTDVRIRYIPSLDILVQPTGTQLAPVIWFARAGLCLARMIAAEFAEIRNAPNAPRLRAKADKNLQIIANKSAKRANQTQTRRRGYGFRRARRTWL